MTTLAAAMLVAGCVFACGGDDDDAPSSSPTRSPVLAGEVSELRRSVVSIALVDDRDAVNDMDIFVGSRIETKVPGIVAFDLHQGSSILSCDVFQDSLLEIGPANGLLVHWFTDNAAGQTGISWCAKPAGGGQQYGVGGRTTITVTDPIFGVSVSGDTATIKVAQGAATISVEGEEDTELVAGEQLVVGLDGPPEKQRLDISDLDREAILGLQEISPLPDLTTEIGEYTEDVGNETCTLEYSVANQGRGTAGESSTLVAIGGRSVTEETRELGPDEAVELSTVVSGSCPYGDELGVVTADSGAVLVESSEENNQDEIFVPPIF